jgi:hypothetical protein
MAYQLSREGSATLQHPNLTIILRANKLATKRNNITKSNKQESIEKCLSSRLNSSPLDINHPVNTFSILKSLDASNCYSEKIIEREGIKAYFLIPAVPNL